MDNHRISRFRWLVRLLLLLSVLALPVAVFADIVQNDVAGNSPFTEIELGDSTTVQYRIVATFGDQQRGCNASDGSAATVQIVAPSQVTASPPSLTFTACGIEQPVVFTPSAAGSYEMTAAVSDSGIGAYNTSPATFTLHVVDTTPPSITITAPTDNGVYLLHEGVGADYACTDLSRVESCAGPVPDGSPIDTASVGTKTFTVDAVDAFENSSSLMYSYSVIYDFAGFFAPIDNIPVLNAVKAGSAVPVKFSLHGDQGLDILAAGYPQSYGISCEGGDEVPIEETVTSGQSSLSYDAAEDQYVYVWKTDKAWARSCRQLFVVLNDGTAHVASFHFK